MATTLITQTLPEFVLPDAAELIWGFVGFGLLMAFMFWKVVPTLRDTLDQRRESIEGQIEQAEATRAEAEELKRQYEQQLADAESRAEEILEEAREQAERLKREAAEQGEEEARQVVARAQAEVESERSRLMNELRGQVATLSVELAGKIVQKEIDAEQHRELVDQYINELSGLN